MTVSELRALLESLPDRFDNTEVVVHSARGLCHIGTVALDRTRMRDDWMPEVQRPKARERKLRITAREGIAPGVLWYEDPPEWRLSGWWPEEAADIGLGAI